ncbi:hypothetical protein DENIS_3131 [Desulfonema ishimotonii]|uniref:Caspase family p20 domain-containing protein n=1 Tax=Desulfonema ishimotonii TaxID=45657 RepID=A0A401FYW2_9BACT|nr:SUMF1/EgtB/PvdO family nonheme iron enzyme [Desulfonema ishimotonii]GBC62168.1 hypothetical protein DENIS_3131 [Desulfonema ishimotonii]
MKKVQWCLLCIALSLFLNIPECCAFSQKRVAFVVGNAAYRNVAALRNTLNDSRLMAETLSDLGFVTIHKENLSWKDFQTSIEEFKRLVELYPDSIRFFYYSGHGIQVNGCNYLIPTDCDLDRSRIKNTAVSMELVMRVMASVPGGTNLIILDACRKNPFARYRYVNQGGLAAMNAPSGTLIAFSTSIGDIASDGGGGENGQYSLYTYSLSNSLKKRDLRILDVFNSVRRIVRKKSYGSQIPWESTSLEGPVILSSRKYSLPRGRIITEVSSFQFKLDKQRKISYHAGIDSSGNSTGIPRKRVKSSKRKLGNTYMRKATGVPGLRERRIGDVEFVFIPRGCFVMGCSNSRETVMCEQDEFPAHEVCLNGFWISKYEITNKHYLDYLRSTSGRQHGAHAEVVMDYQRDQTPNRIFYNPKNRYYYISQEYISHPVAHVSWYGAKDYVDWFSKVYDVSADLPTEAQWEYASRGGESNHFYSGGNKFAQYAWTSVKDGASAPHPVGKKKPNGFGICDMSGNVWEWCGDTYNPEGYSLHGKWDPRVLSGAADHVIRGGSYRYVPKRARCGNRGYQSAGSFAEDIGFRVILKDPDQSYITRLKEK